MSSTGYLKDECISNAKREFANIKTKLEGTIKDNLFKLEEEDQIKIHKLTDSLIQLDMYEARKEEIKKENLFKVDEILSKYVS